MFKACHPKTAKKSDEKKQQPGPEKLKPIVKINPKYPHYAAKEGIEGWVSLSFDVSETGGVENIVVLDSSPKRVFDREAKKALRKWKYQPLIFDGRPQKTRGLIEIVEFKVSN